MSFNYVVSVLPPTSFTAQGGVGSILLTWGLPPDYDRVEVWQSTIDNFAAATRLGSTTGTNFLIEDLPVGTEYFFYIRTVRNFSTGDTKYSAPLSATAAALPTTLEEAQVETVHIAPGAVSTRAIFEETSSQTVRIGTTGGVVVPAGEAILTLPDIPFVGDGGFHIINCLVRANQLGLTWRSTTNAGVATTISASLLDITGGGTLLDFEEIITGQHRLGVLTIGSTTSLVPTQALQRDFTYSFALQTEVDRQYAIRFKQAITMENTANFATYTTYLRQVVWQISKR